MRKNLLADQNGLTRHFSIYESAISINKNKYLSVFHPGSHSQRGEELPHQQLMPAAATAAAADSPLQHRHESARWKHNFSFRQYVFVGRQT